TASKRARSGASRGSTRCSSGCRSTREPMRQQQRVVIVGGGFGGLFAARELEGADIDLTLIDRRNFHLFQPLAYQDATSALSPAEIAAPLRALFKRQRNTRVVLGEVVDFDLAQREVLVEQLPNGDTAAIPYDTLVVAGGR